VSRYDPPRTDSADKSDPFHPAAFGALRVHLFWVGRVAIKVGGTMANDITEETPIAFYKRQIKEHQTHADKLLEMYRNRKIKDTPLTDAIWAGHRLCVNEVEHCQAMLIKVGGQV